MKSNIVGEFFPNGLRVMVVDNDERFLKIAKAMLLSCNYKVMTCKNPMVALSILEEHQEEFDLLLAEIYMQEMTGIQLLDIVHGELQIPVVLMSADTNIELLIKVFMHGASFFIPKPLEMILVKNIWKHSAWCQVRKEKKLKEPENEKKLNKEKNVIIIQDDDDDDTTNTDKRKGKGIATSEDNDVPEIKRPRLVWTAELEEKFQYALNKLGKDAVPRKIVSIMNVEGVDRQHVASHLQKHKLRKQKAEKVAEVVCELNSSLACGKFPEKFRQFSANPNPTSNPNPQATMPQLQPQTMITSANPNPNPNPQATMPQVQPQTMITSANPNLNPNPNPQTTMPQFQPQTMITSANPNPNPQATMRQFQPQTMMTSAHPMSHISHVEECLNKLKSNNNSNVVQPCPPNQAQELATNTEDVSLPYNSDCIEELINSLPELPDDLINDDFSWLNGDFSLSPLLTGAAGDDFDVSVLLNGEMGSSNRNNSQPEEERNGANNQVPVEIPMDVNQVENLGFVQQQQQHNGGNEVGSSSNTCEDNSFRDMMMRIIAENDDMSYMNDGFPPDFMLF